MAKILLVEDHQDSRELLRLILEMDDHTIVEAETGENGLELAKKFLPDLILLDISLAGAIDGLETARRLRADPKFDHTTIFALTAHAMKDDEKMVLAAGCDRYFTKPILDFGIFRDEIEKTLINGRQV